jgi:hypothetical protein
MARTVVFLLASGREKGQGRPELTWRRRRSTARVRRMVAGRGRLGAGSAATPFPAAAPPDGSMLEQLPDNSDGGGFGGPGRRRGQG